MKNFKTKKIVLGTVMALSAVSLASVGFANWIINGITGIDSGNITVTMGQVADTSVTTTMNTGSDLSVAFENVKTVPTGATKLFDNNDDGVEDLKFQLNFKISTTGTTKISTLVDQVTFKFSQSEGFAKCIEKNYIVSPFGAASKDVDNWVSSLTVNLVQTIDVGANPVLTVNKATDGTYMDVTAAFSFKWGSEFNGHNPGYTYEDDSIKADKMKTNLKAFKTLLNGDFNAVVEITPSKKAA